MLYDVYLINSNNYFDPISLNVNCLLAWEMEHKKNIFKHFFVHKMKYFTPVGYKSLINLPKLGEI